jgi:hypothetical protein
MASKRLALFLVLIVLGSLALAQEAKVRVDVNPPEAYIFLDNQAVGDHSRTIEMTPGKHTIGVYNYGFEPQLKEIDVVAGKNPPISFSLIKKGENVSGPWGVIQVENVQRAAILLNGKKPDYFVGHGDLVNNHIMSEELLIVPPGTFQVTATRYGKELYSQPVTVAANERVIIYVNKGEIKRETWSDGGKYSNLPRFDAGTASAKIAVAPVSGTFAATPKIYCNDSTKLDWTSKETIDATIADGAKTMDANPALAGSMLQQPIKTTTYTYEAVGPGGIVKQDQTTVVDPVIESTLETARPEAHYLKLGDKVLTNEPVTLSWTTLHTNDVQLQPHGTVAVNGTQDVIPPDPNVQGEVNQPLTYTLASTNICGGSDSKQVTVSQVGLVEPDIVSVFFPTGYPLKRQPDKGLVGSQQKLVDLLAREFKIYLDHNPDAKIQLTGFTDIRDNKKMNQKLSERRAELVKSNLVALGIPEDRILTAGVGKTQQLDKEAVKQLEAQNPTKIEGKKTSFSSTWLAYNRRVDVTLSPADVQSSRFFPHNTPDSPVLSQRSCPSLSTIRGTQGE